MCHSSQYHHGSYSTWGAACSVVVCTVNVARKQCEKREKERERGRAACNQNGLFNGCATVTSRVNSLKTAATLRFGSTSSATGSSCLAETLASSAMCILNRAVGAV
jgi:hypothetical protein